MVDRATRKITRMHWEESFLTLYQFASTLGRNHIINREERFWNHLIAMKLASTRKNCSQVERIVVKWSWAMEMDRQGYHANFLHRTHPFFKVAQFRALALLLWYSHCHTRTLHSSVSLIFPSDFWDTFTSFLFFTRNFHLVNQSFNPNPPVALKWI